MERRQVFLKALKREPVPYTPIWLMRQAGRYLPEYRKVREQYSFLEMCRTPEVAAEITLQPLRRFELDAAILFSDILIPLPPMGIEVEFVESKGPVITNPVRTVEDIKKVRVMSGDEDTPFVGQAIKIIKEELKEERALIGFSGAPFTLASYAVEGGHSRNYIDVKKLMWNEPEAFNELMEKTSQSIVSYLSHQIESGVDAVQLFDSWVGVLDPADFKEYVLPHLSFIVDALKSKYDVPVIYFGTMTGGLLDTISQLNVDAVGVDWRVRIDEAWQIIGHDKAIQGNLDPVALYADFSVLAAKADDILERVGARPGHVFNLGHGVTPQVSIEAVDFLVNYVHNKSTEIRS